LERVISSPNEGLERVLSTGDVASFEGPLNVRDVASSFERAVEEKKESFPSRLQRALRRL